MISRPLLLSFTVCANQLRCRIRTPCESLSMKKILIDLNVIIDMINKREHHEAAVAVFDRCVKKHDRGYVCAHEITTLAYFLGKDWM